MSFFISDAFAAASAPGQMDSTASMLMMAGIFILFYLLIIRPQSKKAKEHRQLIGKIKAGDEVVIAGGIVGEIIKLVDEQFIVVLVHSGVELLVQRASIAAVLPKGTLNNIKKA